MSERVVEMIEALQKGWEAQVSFPATATEASNFEARTYERCAEALAPTLAAAHEQAQELAALKEQHSADLREIAEMAIAKCGRCGYVMGVDANSIVREFREKQQKAEVKAQ